MTQCAGVHGQSGFPERQYLFGGIIPLMHVYWLAFLKSLHVQVNAFLIGPLFHG